MKSATRRISNGPIQIIINNAGGVLGQVGRPLEEITPEQWSSIFQVNTSGTFYFCQAVAPDMKKGTEFSSTQPDMPQFVTEEALTPKRPVFDVPRDEISGIWDRLEP